MLDDRLPKRVNSRIDVVDDEAVYEPVAKERYTGACAASVWLHVDAAGQVEVVNEVREQASQGGLAPGVAQRRQGAVSSLGPDDGRGAWGCLPQVGTRLLIGQARG